MSENEVVEGKEDKKVKIPLAVPGDGQSLEEFFHEEIKGKPDLYGVVNNIEEFLTDERFAESRGLDKTKQLIVEYEKKVKGEKDVKPDDKDEKPAEASVGTNRPLELNEAPVVEVSATDVGNVAVVSKPVKQEQSKSIPLNIRGVKLINGTELLEEAGFVFIKHTEHMNCMIYPEVITDGADNSYSRTAGKMVLTFVPVLEAEAIEYKPNKVISDDRIDTFITPAQMLEADKITNGQVLLGANAWVAGILNRATMAMKLSDDQTEYFSYNLFNGGAPVGVRMVGGNSELRRRFRRSRVLRQYLQPTLEVINAEMLPNGDINPQYFRYLRDLTYTKVNSVNRLTDIRYTRFWHPDMMGFIDYVFSSEDYHEISLGLSKMAMTRAKVFAASITAGPIQNSPSIGMAGMPLSADGVAGHAMLTAAPRATNFAQTLIQFLLAGRNHLLDVDLQELVTLPDDVGGIASLLTLAILPHDLLHTSTLITLYAKLLRPFYIEEDTIVGGVNVLGGLSIADRIVTGRVIPALPRPTVKFSGKPVGGAINLIINRITALLRTLMARRGCVLSPLNASGPFPNMHGIVYTICPLNNVAVDNILLGVSTQSSGDYMNNSFSPVSRIMLDYADLTDGRFPKDNGNLRRFQLLHRSEMDRISSLSINAALVRGSADTEIQPYDNVNTWANLRNSSASAIITVSAVDIAAFYLTGVGSLYINDNMMTIRSALDSIPTPTNGFFVYMLAMAITKHVYLQLNVNVLRLLSEYREMFRKTVHGIINGYYTLPEAIKQAVDVVIDNYDRYLLNQNWMNNVPDVPDKFFDDPNVLRQFGYEETRRAPKDVDMLIRGVARRDFNAGPVARGVVPGPCTPVLEDSFTAGDDDVDPHNEYLTTYSALNKLIKYIYVAGEPLIVRNDGNPNEQEKYTIHDDVHRSAAFRILYAISPKDADVISFEDLCNAQPTSAVTPNEVSAETIRMMLRSHNMRRQLNIKYVQVRVKYAKFRMEEIPKTAPTDVVLNDGITLTVDRKRNMYGQRYYIKGGSVPVYTQGITVSDLTPAGAIRESSITRLLQVGVLVNRADVISCMAGPRVRVTDPDDALMKIDLYSTGPDFGPEIVSPTGVVYETLYTFATRTDDIQHGTEFSTRERIAF